MKLRNGHATRAVLRRYEQLIKSCSTLTGAALTAAMDAEMTLLQEKWQRCNNCCYIRCTTGRRADIPNSPYVIRKGINPRTYCIQGSLADVAQEIDRIKAKIL